MSTDGQKSQPGGQSPDLEKASHVLVRMEGFGRANARRFLARCTAQEISRLAACDSGVAFAAAYGQVMDEILKRLENGQAQNTTE